MKIPLTFRCPSLVMQVKDVDELLNKLKTEAKVI